MHLILDDSLIRLNSNILETNILNLLVVLSSLGVLIRQYSNSVVDSYEIVLYDIIADSYSLEKELQVIEAEYITTLSKIIRIYLNALLSYRSLMLEVKVKLFVRTECLRHRFLEFDKKATQVICQDFFKKWRSDIFEIISNELIERFTANEKSQMEFIDLKIGHLEDEDFGLQVDSEE